MIPAKILQEISKEDLLDYKFLAQAKNLKLYPKILDELLQKAYTSFEQILKLSKDQINFKNIVENYLNHDRLLTILYTFLDSLNNTNNTPETQKIIKDFEPKIVDYYNKTTLHPGYYSLLHKVARSKVISDQARSIFLLLKGMRMAGVSLPEKQRKTIEKINKELSKLSQEFNQNTIDSKKLFFYEFHDDKALKEMPPLDLKLAQQEAKNRKLKSKYVFTLSPPSLQAILKYCSDRSIRETFYKKAFTVASEGKYDNRPLILKILKLRQQKAKLLGHHHYADYVLQARMAKSTKQIETLLQKIFVKAHHKANQEVAELGRFSGLKELEEWDISYYSEKYRQQKFKLEEKELKKYFPLPQVTKGLFAIMSKFFGITFKQIKGQGYNPDLQFFEIWKEKKLLAYYIADFTARASKKGGAWCNHLRPGFITSDGKYHIPIVINVMNFPSSDGSEPSLLSFRDVETLFHEFGHALHLTFSSQTYANLNGFHTEWDFVEFPSQILENWCSEMLALKLFAKHYQTGKIIPPALISKIHTAKTFMSGYQTMRQLEFALLDLKLHLQKIPKSVTELDKICTKIVQQCSLLKKFKGYRMYASFDHIFAGGYAAGYYSYMWAEILEADVYLKIKRGGILNPRVGNSYREKILQPGARKDGQKLFKDFMGRNPDASAFIQKHELK